MIHRSLVAEAAERAIEKAQDRVTLVDVLGLAASIYLAICVFSAVAR